MKKIFLLSMIFLVLVACGLKYTGIGPEAPIKIVSKLVGDGLFYDGNFFENNGVQVGTKDNFSLKFLSSGLNRIEVSTTENVGFGEPSTPSFPFHFRTQSSGEFVFDHLSNTPEEGPTLNGRRSYTSAGSPATTQSSLIFTMGARGYGASSWHPFSMAAVSLWASETQSVSSQGSFMYFEVTDSGTTGRFARVGLSSHGGLTLGSPLISGASVALQLNSTTKAFTNVRMTKAQRDAIGFPTEGMTIYQTDNSPGLRSFNGTNWVRLSEIID